MGQMDGKWDKVLELFYEEPDKSFTVREIAQKTKIPKSTVQRHLTELRTKHIVSEDNRAVISPIFKIKKTNHYIEKLFESGLIEFLEKYLTPSCIILFGSFRKGESVNESDIDIFAETTKKVGINLTSFEKKIGHNIQLFREKNINDLPDRLFNNIVNGIKLSGFFKIR